MYNNFIQYYLRFSTIVVIVSALFLLYLLFMGSWYTENLRKKTYSLGIDITTEKVEDLILHLDVKYIPFRFYTYGLIKAGYKLVSMDTNIDEELKKRLMIKILSRGILVD